MSKIDEQWVREQLQAVRAKVGVGNTVLGLMKYWETVTADDEQAKEALDIFIQLAQGHALISTPDNEIWVPAQAGSLIVGDVVRVRHDAFDGATGLYHNGRVGKVIAVRYGDVIFRTTDGKEPLIDGSHYPPAKLDKRIQ